MFIVDLCLKPFIVFSNLMTQAMSCTILPISKAPSCFPSEPKYSLVKRSPASKSRRENGLTSFL